MLHGAWLLTRPQSPSGAAHGHACMHVCDVACLLPAPACRHPAVAGLRAAVRTGPVALRVPALLPAGLQRARAPVPALPPRASRRQLSAPSTVGAQCALCCCAVTAAAQQHAAGLLADMRQHGGGMHAALAADGRPAVWIPRAVLSAAMHLQGSCKLTKTTTNCRDAALKRAVELRDACTQP